MVFTHGWVDDRTVWDGVIAQLTDAATGPTAHCVSWDLRGHGESDAPPPGNYTREHALADMERIVTAAGTPCVLAGSFARRVPVAGLRARCTPTRSRA